MEKQRKNMLWKIPLIVTISVAAFWGIWYLVNGEIPVVTEIKWDLYNTSQLPLAISCLWNIPLAFVLAFVLVFFFTSKGIKGNEELKNDLIALLIVFIFFNMLVAVLFDDLSHSLGTGLIFGSMGLLALAIVFGIKALFFPSSKTG